VLLERLWKYLFDCAGITGRVTHPTRHFTTFMLPLQQLVLLNSPFLVGFSLILTRFQLF
jgi:hypothetical protein